MCVYVLSQNKTKEPVDMVLSFLHSKGNGACTLHYNNNIMVALHTFLWNGEMLTKYFWLLGLAAAITRYVKLLRGDG